jgi:hypothetical protein
MSLSYVVFPAQTGATIIRMAAVGVGVNDKHDLEPITSFPEAHTAYETVK